MPHRCLDLSYVKDYIFLDKIGYMDNNKLVIIRNGDFVPASIIKDNFTIHDVTKWLELKRIRVATEEESNAHKVPVPAPVPTPATDIIKNKGLDDESKVNSYLIQQVLKLQIDVIHNKIEQDKNTKEHIQAIKDLKDLKEEISILRKDMDFADKEIFALNSHMLSLSGREKTPEPKPEPIWIDEPISVPEIINIETPKEDIIEDLEPTPIVRRKKKKKVKKD